MYLVHAALDGIIYKMIDTNLIKVQWLYVGQVLTL